METNIGVLDGVFRFTLGMGLLGWVYDYFDVIPPAALVWPVWLVGLAFALTGFFRYSPLYALLKIDSCAPYPHEKTC